MMMIMCGYVRAQDLCCTMLSLNLYFCRDKIFLKINPLMCFRLQGFWRFLVIIPRPGLVWLVCDSRIKPKIKPQVKLFPHKP